eukprot:756715-Pleurochrysis_carterae.AAC.1
MHWNKQFMNLRLSTSIPKLDDCTENTKPNVPMRCCKHRVIYASKSEMKVADLWIATAKTKAAASQKAFQPTEQPD